MLDHALLDAIAAMRSALEGALLERHTFEERLQVDVLLGDMTWETSYALPGEGIVPRVQAEITFGWSTWSQSAYRSLTIGEPVDEPPEIDMEILLRVQRLSQRPDPKTIAAALPEEGPELPGDRLHRANPIVEELYDDEKVQYAVEVAYDGLFQFDPDALEAGKGAEPLGALGAWIASNLVKLADLDLVFLPPEIGEDELR
jgi:hypothetical protein